MADIAINYELLNQLGRDTDTLKHRVDDARHSRRNFSLDDAGPSAAAIIELYYSAWDGAFKHAYDLLESLSNTYTGVARQWFDQDAQYAANASDQEAILLHNRWASEKAEYDRWVKLSQTYIPSHGFDEDGDPYPTMVPLADPNQPPPQPGQEPLGTSYDGDGVHHTTSAKFDSDGLPTEIDTTITDGDGGLSYHEHTTFGQHGSYTSTVTTSDGTKITDTVTGNADGTGSRTVTIVDSQGKTTTESYTGTGLNDDDNPPTWTETGGSGSSGKGGKGDDNHPDPKPDSHAPKQN